MTEAEKLLEYLQQSGTHKYYDMRKEVWKCASCGHPAVGDADDGHYPDCVWLQVRECLDKARKK